uniref:AcidPPc domain-containing protein n=1 Tax=Rhabditophanes sp. KR3021 TaxID=114890 RepID=A0AC35TVH8_9BILA
MLGETLQLNLFNLTFSKRYLENWTTTRRRRSNTYTSFLFCGVDVALVLAILIAFYHFGVKSVFAVRHLDVDCGDISIREKFHENTVSSLHLLAVTLGVPFLTIGLCCLANNFNKTHKYGYGIVLAQTTFHYINFLFIFFVMTVLLEAVKCGVGRHRPHFIDVCKADLSVCETDPNATIKNIVCDTTDKQARNIRTSFPSGHSAAAVFSLYYVFSFLEYQFKATSNTSKSIKSFVLIVLAAWTIFCCGTRVTDKWHHQTDVIAGIIFGFILSVGLTNSCSKQVPLLKEE